MRATAIFDDASPNVQECAYGPSTGRSASGGGTVQAAMWDCRCALHGRHFILAKDTKTAHAIALSQGLKPRVMYPLPAHVSPVFGDQTCIKA